jgi:hypothetical protein
LVTAEKAQIIAQEVRADFRSAVAKTQKLAIELDELARLQSRRPSPPPVGVTALKATKPK